MRITKPTFFRPSRRLPPLRYCRRHRHSLTWQIKGWIRPSPHTDCRRLGTRIISGKCARIVPAKGPGIPVENTYAIGYIFDAIAGNRTPIEAACVPKHGGLRLSGRPLRLNRRMPGRFTITRKNFVHRRAAFAVCQCSEKLFDVRKRA